MTQMSVKLKQLDFLHSISASGMHVFQVSSEPPVICFNKGEGDLYAGVTNTMVLSVFCGSRVVEASVFFITLKKEQWSQFQVKFLTEKKIKIRRGPG